MSNRLGVASRDEKSGTVTGFLIGRILPLQILHIKISLALSVHMLSMLQLIKLLWGKEPPRSMQSDKLRAGNLLLGNLQSKVLLRNLWLQNLRLRILLRILLRVLLWRIVLLRVLMNATSRQT
jgi:hypothetical protein